MHKTIEAVYEDGVIKPLEKLYIKEHEKLTITIVREPMTSKPKKPALPLVGIFNSGMQTLSSEHDKHLYGWKKAK